MSRSSQRWRDAWLSGRARQAGGEETSQRKKGKTRTPQKEKNQTNVITAANSKPSSWTGKSREINGPPRPRGKESPLTGEGVCKMGGVNTASAARLSLR